MMYSPFERQLNDLTSDDLVALRDVAEGWYIEYKSAPLPTKRVAKSLSAFANHYGGWLFFGVNEKNERATSFCGLDASQVEEVIRSLRNASTDCLNPHVFFDHKVIAGPNDDLQLPQGRSVVVVCIPPGMNTPYVHSDGRIYRRIADSSDPKQETDRGLLDDLWKRGHAAREKLSQLIVDVPTVSKSEADTPFIHIFLSADPFEVSNSPPNQDFDEFRELMSGSPLPFDNFFSRGTGHIARQVARNDARNRVFTWEHFRSGHSRVTLPINRAVQDLELWLDGYSYSDRFVRSLHARAHTDSDPAVLDLNMLFAALCAATLRHRQLLDARGHRGPFYAKVFLENIWRCVPFLDTRAFIEFVEENGLPVIQDDSLILPPGLELDTFLVLPEREPDPSIEAQVGDALRLVSWAMSGLGIPSAVLARSAEELGHLLPRAEEVQARRNDARPR